MSFCLYHCTLFFSHVLFSDEEAPILEPCPNNQSVNTDRYKATALVHWVEPNAIDNSGSSNITCDPSSGSDFIGETKVTCTARDESNNEDTCSFYVNVNGMFVLL